MILDDIATAFSTLKGRGSNLFNVGYRLEETLKWGEPSFVTQNGSTLQIDWKEKTPNQYAMYFQCKGRLIDTFRLVLDHQLKYERNRAIVFQLNQKIPA